MCGGYRTRPKENVVERGRERQRLESSRIRVRVHGTGGDAKEEAEANKKNVKLWPVVHERNRRERRHGCRESRGRDVTAHTEVPNQKRAQDTPLIAAA